MFGKGKGGVRQRKTAGRRAPVDVPPVTMFCSTFQSLTVNFCRSCGELSKSGDGTANVRTSGDAGMQKFAEWGAAGETHFFGERCALRSALSKARSSANGMMIGFREWFKRLESDLTFSNLRCRPIVGG